MLLVVDIGNTNITLGLFKGDQVVEQFRLRTVPEKTSDEYSVFIHSLLNEQDLKSQDIEGAIISSVVPFIMHAFVGAIKKVIKKEPLIVGPGVKTGIAIRTDNPSEVGADRIVDLVAAYSIYGGPVMVIDFGTATTYDVVTKDGAFEVGITSPGIRICADALWKNTAQLPEIEIKKPNSILARNTITSMQAGLVYGYIGQVEYMIRKVKEEMKLDMPVVATGGLGRVVLSEFPDIIYDPDLTLKGLKIIYDKNRKSSY